VTDAAGQSAAPRSDSPKATSPRGKLARFDLVERLVHWSTAIMMLTLIFTGASLYFPALGSSPSPYARRARSRLTVCNAIGPLPQPPIHMTW
jgi:hypothetical protein